MPTQQLEQIDWALDQHVASVERVLLLISRLRDGLNDAITVGHLKSLCEAICREVELSGVPRGKHETLK